MTQTIYTPGVQTTSAPQVAFKVVRVVISPSHQEQARHRLAADLDRVVAQSAGKWIDHGQARKMLEL